MPQSCIYCRLRYNVRLFDSRQARLLEAFGSKVGADLVFSWDGDWWWLWFSEGCGTAVPDDAIGPCPPKLAKLHFALAFAVLQEQFSLNMIYI